MLLELTITQLDIGKVSSQRARELGHLGYMQWLGALPAAANYNREARRAYEMAAPFAGASPAVGVLCDLLVASLQSPLEPLPLELPNRARRGGANARRADL
ncbi:MAG: hypothetical protein AAF871_02735 [Pseudomonadota bacterium]